MTKYLQGKYIINYINTALFVLQKGCVIFFKTEANKVNRFVNEFSFLLKKKILTLESFLVSLVLMK